MSNKDLRQDPNTKELVVQSVQGTQIANYGEREVVMELVSRVMDFHPAIREVREVRGEEAALELGFQTAQLALLMGASPIPSLNEIHVWSETKSRKVNGQWETYIVDHVDPGKNYWERRGRQVAGGIHWEIAPRVMKDEEYKEYGIDKSKTIGAICVGARYDDLDKKVALVKSGMLSAKEAREGSLVTGVGTVDLKYKNGKEKETKAGRPLSWDAIKRCRKDFYTNACPYIPGESFAVGDGLSRDEDGEIGLNTKRLNMEVIEFEPERKTITDEEARAFNEALFGGGEVDDVDEPIADEPIEGDFIDNTEPGPEVEETAVSEEESTFRQLQEDDPRISLLTLDQWQTLQKVTAAKWMELAIEIVKRYDNAVAIGKVAKRLGYEKVPGGNKKDAKLARSSILLDVNYYATQRVAGMDQEQAVEAVESVMPF